MPNIKARREAGRRYDAAILAAAKIITPGAWWDGEPPNEYRSPFGPVVNITTLKP